ncbi:3-hydroxyacyl-CoA dehydrogenase [Dethiosulfatibacter aminovorans DSM 17477]|uniref:3-hydroxyacyl-CoA dehydrogenase n=1 Tax=Dethiosulfatibacter aminovorans DSM 17477 TaxID=1121476 RepID=A0A1M6BZ80_9FIRM|nr:enoyl-CoA hydratase/isomerase family protein [Dethiosulfatibacter aminovorans]SHI53901.1 3-hydroxyacyl-CoA dehydrogenase [Dethiosulfatibacter aminovorans DSM 17477]
MNNGFDQYAVVSSFNNIEVRDMEGGIAALIIGDSSAGIDSKTAEWIAETIEKIETDIDGLVIVGCDNAAIKVDAAAEDVDSIQKFIRKIKLYNKPVVSIVSGPITGAGYDIVKNSHGVVAGADITKTGYDFKNGVLPLGGGLTSHIMDTYGMGDGIRGMDIIPFLKVLVDRIILPSKAESTEDFIGLGLLPKDTVVLGSDVDMVAVAKNKAPTMAVEGFKPYVERTVTAVGTMGQAALGIVLLNRHEGLFMPDDIYEKALGVVKVISGGDVPKGTEVPEEQLLKLESEYFKNTIIGNEVSA